jgi:hypothetical protein
VGRGALKKKFYPNFQKKQRSPRLVRGGGPVNCLVQKVKKAVKKVKKTRGEFVLQQSE